MAILRILNGCYAGHVKRLSEESFVFGRGRECDLVLGNVLVSREHAKISCAKGRYFVEDLGSLNGTSVNGRKIAAPWALSSQDWIEIGDMICQFVDGTSSVVSGNRPPNGASHLDQFDRRGFAQHPTAVDSDSQGMLAVQADPQVKLQALLQITRDLGACLDPANIQQRIVDCTLRIYPHAEGVHLLQSDETTGRLLPVAVKKRDHGGDSTLTLGRIPHEALKQAVESRATVVSEPREQSSIDVDCRWFMCSPMFGSSGDLLGVVYIECREGQESRSAEDKDLLTCIAALAAQAIEHVQTHGRRYRAVVNTSAQGILTFDERGRIESANPASAQLFDCHVGRIVGRSISTLIPQFAFGDAQQRAQTLQVFSQGPAQSPQETEGRQTNGAAFPIEVSLAEFQLDGASRYTVICQDITQRKRADKELRDSQERLSKIVRTDIVGIAFGDSTGKILDVNDRFCRMVGYRREELVDHGINWKSLTADDCAQLDRRALAELSHKGAYGPYEKECVCKDGGRIPVSVSVAMLPDKGDEHVIFMVDNSRQKEAERQLKSLNAALEKTVVERTRNVRMLQDVAVIANEAESLQEAFQSATETICRHAGWPGGRSFFLLSNEDAEVFVQSEQWHWEPGPPPKLKRRPDEVIERAIATGKPAYLRGGRKITEALGLPRTAKGFELAIAFPILLREKVCGVLEVLAREPAPPSDELLQTMTHICTQLARVVERRQLQQELIDVVWRQHRKFGQDLHDSLGQELTGIRMMAETLASRLSGKPDPEADSAAELTRFIHDAQQNARRLSKGLFPVEIFEQGLFAALEELAEITSARAGLKCDFYCDQSIQAPGNDIATHLFRIAQEAVNNAVKHGRARTVEISLSQRRQWLMLQVKDDGVGITDTTAESRGGMGLRIMRYRANAIGGKLIIRRNESRETEVRCALELADYRKEAATRWKSSSAHR